MTEFRYRGLWQWNPVSCVTPRSYDEKWMMAHGERFFDRSLMSRYFDALAEAGLNTWILANTHPFPFMVDLSSYPDAVVLPQGELRRHQSHYHWLFETARKRGILPFVLFHTCYVPDAFGKKHSIRPTHSFEPPPLAVEYTRHCVRELCRTYPELEGVNGEASENVAPELRASFAERAIVAGIHASGRRPVLFFRGWVSDPAQMKQHVMDAYEGECFFTVKYTWEFLVHRKPDPEFRRWVETCGADHVLGEFWISNYQPFGCHDTKLAEGIREELHALGCPGFTSHPMDLYGAPFVQGSKPQILQIERDMDWYATLSGGWREGSRARMEWFGLATNEAPDASARAACVPSQRISYYLTGNKQNFLQPQWLAFIGGPPDRRAGLHTFFRWANLPRQTRESFGRWMEQIDGVRVRYPGEAGEGFSLGDLVEELDRLEREWAELPEGSPHHPGAYAAWRRDLMALRCMAHAWAERARAVQSHFSGHADRVAPALRRSLEYARQMPKLTGYGGPYRLLVGRHVVILRWTDLCDALQQEMGDCALSRLKDSYFFGRADHYDPPGANVAGDRK